MQREERQWEMTLDAILSRLNDLRISIGEMIIKLETDTDSMNWPTFLDNFALISSHITGLTKILGKDQCPPLRNRTVLPLMLTQDRDETLISLTNGRLPTFAHDVVPIYLRTKPDPLSEQKMLQNEQKASNLSQEVAVKQVAQYNKVVTHVLDMVGKARLEWESESSSRTGIQQTSSMSDTHALVAAVGMGKNLKIPLPIAVPGAGPGTSGMMPTIRPSAAMGAGSPGSVNQMGKAPSGIKTNIKSAMQVHPYPR